MHYVRRMTSRRLQHAADLARTGSIDHRAPVVASASIDVAAPASAVHQVLTDLEQWPTVLPGVTRLTLDAPGVTGEGAHFTWRNNGFPLRSTMQRIRPESEVTWTGQALWIIAIHRNTIEPTDQGCRLTSTESMTGWAIARLMPAATLERQLQSFGQAIAREAERRA